MEGVFIWPLLKNSVPISWNPRRTRTQAYFNSCRESKPKVSRGNIGTGVTLLVELFQQKERKNYFNNNQNM
jgi:hypothetical protein